MVLINSYTASHREGMLSVHFLYQSVGIPADRLFIFGLVRTNGPLVSGNLPEVNLMKEPAVNLLDVKDQMKINEVDGFVNLDGFAFSYNSRI